MSPHSQKATDLLHNPDFLFVISKVISAGLWNNLNSWRWTHTGSWPGMWRGGSLPLREKTALDTSGRLQPLHFWDSRRWQRGRSRDGWVRWRLTGLPRTTASILSSGLLKTWSRKEIAKAMDEKEIWKPSATASLFSLCLPSPLQQAWAQSLWFLHLPVWPGRSEGWKNTS